MECLGGKELYGIALHNLELNEAKKEVSQERIDRRDPRTNYPGIFDYPSELHPGRGQVWSLKTSSEALLSLA